MLDNVESDKNGTSDKKLLLLKGVTPLFPVYVPKYSVSLQGSLVLTEDKLELPICFSAVEKQSVPKVGNV